MNRILLFIAIISIFIGCNTTSTPNQPISVPKEKIVLSTPPPTSQYDYDTTLWTELYRLDSTIQIIMKYATTDNFVKEKMYECSRCFLRPEVARQIVEIHRQLQAKGLGLKMLDCYRPKPIQQRLWNKVPDARYVTPPNKGSMHNRGLAVDLTLVDADGNELDMGTPYDFFGEKAYPAYTDLPGAVLDRRRLLTNIMMEYGFRPIRTEWWHFSYPSVTYPISEMVWACK